MDLVVEASPAAVAAAGVMVSLVGGRLVEVDGTATIDIELK